MERAKEKEERGKRRREGKGERERDGEGERERRLGGAETGMNPSFGLALPQATAPLTYFSPGHTLRKQTRCSRKAGGYFWPHRHALSGDRKNTLPLQLV